MSSQDNSTDRHEKRRGAATRYLKRLGIGLFIVLAVLAAIGATFQAVASTLESGSGRPPGRRFDVLGSSLHLYCTGQVATGGVTVLLESGLGGTTSSWARIQGYLSRFTRVCSHDRAGIGWSDSSATPRTGANIARELHALLMQADVEGRLLLVGHSTGGLYAREYRSQYPDDVAAIALLDASNENQFCCTAEGRQNLRQIKTAYTVLPLAARLGLVRLSRVCDNFPTDFPLDARKDYRRTCSQTSSWTTQQRELIGLEATMAAVKLHAGLKDLPLLVVTAGNDPQNPSDWPDLQKSLAMLSVNSMHVVRANATHPGLLTNSEDAEAVSAAVLRLLKILS